MLNLPSKVMKQRTVVVFIRHTGGLVMSLKDSEPPFSHSGQELVALSINLFVHLFNKDSLSSSSIPSFMLSHCTDNR